MIRAMLLRARPTVAQSLSRQADIRLLEWMESLLDMFPVSETELQGKRMGVDEYRLCTEALFEIFQRGMGTHSLSGSLISIRIKKIQVVDFHQNKKNFRPLVSNHPCSPSPE